MSEKTQEEKVLYKLTDTSIAMIRDLLQLALILNINIIDELRAMRFDINERTGALTPAAEYVKAYNAMVEKLEEQAIEASKKLDAEEAAANVAEAEVASDTTIN